MIYDLVTEAGDFALWDRAPRRSVVICTHMRSGSTLLGEALYGAGGLGNPLEYFSPIFRASFVDRWNARTDAAYLAALFAHRTSPSGTFSTKLFWEDVQHLVMAADPPGHAGFASHVAAQVPDDLYRAAHAVLTGMLPNPVWVRLTRADVLRQAVSWYLAGETGAWRSYGDKVPTRREEKPYDYRRILSVLMLIESYNAHWAKFFEVNRLSPIIVRYEALAEQYTQTVDALLQSLGGEKPSAPPARLRRQSGAYSDAVLARFKQEHHLKMAQGLNPAPAPANP